MIRIVEELGNAYPTYRVNVVRSGGPERVEVGDTDPEFKPRPVGFTARLEADGSPREVETPTPAPSDVLRWEGDDS